MFPRILMMIFALMAITGPTHAANIKPWKFSNNITWTHPDGRKIKGSMIETFVNDDKLMIFRERGGRYYMRFALYDNSVLVDRRTSFFVLDNRDDRKARMLALEIDGRAWPGKAPLAGVAVTQLTNADLSLLRQHSGNLLGVSYFSRKPGEQKNGYSRNYRFSGEGFARALASLTGVQTPSTVSQAPRPKPAAEPQKKASSDSPPRIEVKPLPLEKALELARKAPPGSNASNLAFLPTWGRCDVPDINSVNSVSSAQRVHRATKIYHKCVLNNLRDASREVQKFYGKRGVKVTGLFPRWNSGQAIRADQDKNLKRTSKYMMDYNAKTIGLVQRSHAITRKWISHSD